jgi:glycosyltransferase involved in cell wall biosynthesis
LITFAIPCYNSNYIYLRHAVDSVLSQNCNQWKLIIVDGNKVPDANLERLVLSLDRESVSYQYNKADKSMAGNWNFCLEVADTELVCLLHDDDFLSVNYIQEMIELAEKKSFASAYFCSVNLINAQNKRAYTLADYVKKIIKPKGNLIVLEGDNGLASLLKGCYIYCPSLVYRKSMICSAPFDSNWSMVTDLKFYTETLLNGGNIVGTSNRLFNYRRHNNNQTAILTDDLQRFKEELDVYDSLLPILSMKKWKRSYYQANLKIIIRFHLLFQLLKTLLKCDFYRMKKVLRLIWKGC